MSYVFEVEIKDKVLWRTKNNNDLKDEENGIKTLTLRKWLNGALKRF